MGLYIPEIGKLIYHQGTSWDQGSIATQTIGGINMVHYSFRFDVNQWGNAENDDHNYNTDFAEFPYFHLGQKSSRQSGAQIQPNDGSAKSKTPNQLCGKEDRAEGLWVSWTRCFRIKLALLWMLDNKVSTHVPLQEVQCVRWLPTQAFIICWQVHWPRQLHRLLLFPSSDSYSQYTPHALHR